MKKITLIAGTRPELIKLIPVFKAFQSEESIKCDLLLTGQHREMLNQVLKDFNITDYINLDLMTESQSPTELLSKILKSFSQINLKADMLICHGDTLTTLAVSIYGFFNQIKVGHIEAGLRSNDLHAPWPEEFNRRVVSLGSAYHFCPTSDAENNLLLEGIAQRNIFVVGNTVLDAVNLILHGQNQSIELTLDASGKNFKYNLLVKQYIVITVHRRESFGAGMKNICEAIRNLSHEYSNIDFILPVHLNPNVANLVRSELYGLNNVYLIKPLSYSKFIPLISQSQFVLSDSGGLQEEAPYLGRQVVLMRDKTERPEMVSAGYVKLAGTNVSNINLLFKKAFSERDLYKKSCLIYGNGNSSEIILRATKRILKC